MTFVERDSWALILHDVDCPDGPGCDATPTAMGRYYRMVDALIAYVRGEEAGS